MISRDRVLVEGLNPHEHEREAWAWLKTQLPDRSPYLAAAFFELKSGGRLYEVDALVLGPQALYLIEMKAWRGKVRAQNAHDWLITSPEGHRYLRENPYRLANLKAKVLANQLLTAMGQDQPRVEALVFLTDPDVRAELHGADLDHVVTRHSIERALTLATFPGADSRLGERRVSAPVARQVRQALERAGLVPSKGARRVGDVTLVEEIAAGPGYVDWLGDNTFTRGIQRRVRCYEARPGATDEERRALVDAARREAGLLARLGDHPHILRTIDAVGEGPHGGPCVVFEWRPDLLPLETFLAEHKDDLTLLQRYELIEQVAAALRFAHEQNIVHRGVSPRTVWASRDAKGHVFAQLIDFQLARSVGSGNDTSASSGTIHLTRHSAVDDAVYRAPELVQDPSCDDARVDVYALGALAYTILTGRPPATSHIELVDKLREGRLSIAAVDDALAAGMGLGEVDAQALKTLDEQLLMALALHPEEREDNPVRWSGELLNALTLPELRESSTAAGVVAPEQAQSYDYVSSDLLVDTVLGTGTTGRALRVLRGDEMLVLKVPLQPEFASRLVEEARQLERVHASGHPGAANIVRVLGTPHLGGTATLLLSDAGDTLADLLRRDGPPALEFVERWGDELIAALEALEAAGVLHRDIKAANVGIGGRSAHLRQRLQLFDFSLAAAALENVGVGTQDYLDPWLARRGRADAAADRYAAAVTLYELLVGARPRPPAGRTQHVDDVPLEVEGDRFDASVRGALTAFFRRAFAASASERHASAEAMRSAWTRAFVGTEAGVAAAGDGVVGGGAASPTPATGSRRQSGAGDGSGATTSTMPDVDLHTPVAALGLSPRAISALDRAGVTNVGELLALPRNRLSIVRGVGAQTQRELFEKAESLRRERPEWEAEAGRELDAFYPDYHGGDAAVEFVGAIAAVSARRLRDAGLGRVYALVASPRAHVEHLLADMPGEIDALRHWLHDTQAGRQADMPPATIEAWIDALLAHFKGRNASDRANKRRNAEVLYGLASARGGYVEHGLTEAAERLDLSRLRLHQIADELHEIWELHPQIDQLRGAVADALGTIGGLGSVEEVAQALPALLPFAPAGDANDLELRRQRERRARALVRMAAESSPTMLLHRTHARVWLARDAAAFAALEPLGAAALALAQREPLPSPTEVETTLRAALDASHGLGHLAAERLARLAAHAARQVAVSARLELYRQGMPADRALRLVSGALQRAQLTPGEVQRVVAARYPEALSLPPRPALDALLEPLGLRWDAVRERYARPEARPSTSATLRTLTRGATAGSSTRRWSAPSEEESQARDFDDRLRRCLENGSVLVVEISAERAEQAARALERRIGEVVGQPVPALALDRALIAALRASMARRRVAVDAVRKADAAGPEGPDWPRLGVLVRDAATAVAAAFEADAARPRLVVRPGLLGRYGLAEFAERLFGATRPRGQAATVLVLPSQERDAPGALIDGPGGGLALPVPQHGRALVPATWLARFGASDGAGHEAA